MKRESGYYWVKISNEWFIALWQDYKYKSFWKVSVFKIEYCQDSDFEEIDERRILRDEPKIEDTGEWFIDLTGQAHWRQFKDSDK